MNLGMKKTSMVGLQKS